MKSNVALKDQEALIKLYKSMTPEERLVAFLNLSRLMHKVAQAGKRYRKDLKVLKTPTRKSHRR